MAASLYPSNYRLISYSPGLDDMMITSTLNCVKNITLLKQTGQKKNYNLGREGGGYDNAYMYSLADKKIIVLGYDKRRGVWYSEHGNVGAFENYLKRLTPLTQKQFEDGNVSVQCRYDESMQKVVLEMVHNLEFGPPLIIHQEVSHDAILSTQRAQVHEKKMESIPINEGLATFFGEIYKQNKGLFIGHNHSSLEKGLGQFLVSQLDHLHQLGLRHIYEELPAPRLYGVFSAFNKNQDQTGDALKQKLVKLGVMNINGRMQIYKAARDKGIQVWPIESYGKNLTTDASYRLQVGDPLMVRNIDFYSEQLKADEKFLVLGGIAHHRVASQYAMPNICIDGNFEQYKMRMLLMIASNPDQDGEKEEDDTVSQKNKNLWEQLTPEERLSMYTSPDFFIFYQNGNQAVTIYKDYKDF